MAEESECGRRAEFADIPKECPSKGERLVAATGRGVLLGTASPEGHQFCRTCRAQLDKRGHALVQLPSRP